MEDKFTREELRDMLQNVSGNAEGFAVSLINAIDDENLSTIQRQQAAGDFFGYVDKLHKQVGRDFDEFISPETIQLAYQNLAREKIMATHLANFVALLDRANSLDHLPDGAMRSYDEVMRNAFGPLQISPIHGGLYYKIS